ncbi:PREDICTED: RNA-binding protein 41 [Gekko japonicus]|uniref:RNA-binding protein 41 n=1 Tax=Gekko japonicus TaxID=146911 RepID=A0ABM1JSL1_GEKJA|nr:PREDICTED: RNA-binding protein 41 [Gekko japonicus]
MKRVNSSSLSGEDLLLEDLETEGERQLKSLLHHQLNTSASIEECVSKRRRFAPAAVYKPFGEEAAGTHSLPQFQALQESNKEIASLRELGLSESEIHLWKNHASAGKSSGLGAAPEAMWDRIQAIQEKIAECQRILSLPQRFAGSKELSRREMEIENALFQGTDRHSFLRMLYHQDEVKQKATHEKDPMAHLDTVYQEILSQGQPESVQPSTSELSPSCSGTPSPSPLGQDLTPQSVSGPVKVTEVVEFVPEEEILKNRLSEEEIRKIPRFSSYNPGEPNKVLYLKNFSPRVTVKHLMSLFARFQEKDGPEINFRMLSGRMRGQAFLTFSSVSTAQAALKLVNGFNLLGKPLVIEFGRNKVGQLHPDAESAPSSGSSGSLQRASSS